MKVAFFLYDANPSGGMKVLFRLGNVLQERGWDVEYLVAERERELPFPSKCRFRFAEKNYPNALGKVAWLVRQRVDVDVAIATFHWTAYGLLWNQSQIARRMYYVQAWEPEFYLHNWKLVLRRWPIFLASSATYFLPLERVVNCEGSRRGLGATERENAPEFPPGIDLSLYKPRAKKNEVPVIGHLGRKEPWKDSDSFFRAMVRLRELGYKFHVRVAYDLWPDTHGLEYEVVKPRTETELAEFYSSLDILVSTVMQKGFGMPPLESMACGAICVGTHMDYGTDGVDFVQYTAGFAESIVEKVRAVLAMPQERRDAIVAAGLRTARAYDWQVLGDRWSEYLMPKQPAAKAGMNVEGKCETCFGQ